MSESDSRTWIIPLVVALVVLVIVIMGVSGAFSKIGFLVSLFPSLNKTQEVPDGNLIIGVDLLGDGSLEYYDGISWQKFESDKKFVVRGFGYFPADISKKMTDFYYHTQRIGSKKYAYDNLIFEADDGAEGLALLGEQPNLFIGGMVYVDATHVFANAEEDFRFSISLDNSVNKGEDVPQEVIDYYISYRDQILKDEACEKHISIGEHSYAVRKVDSYLVVNTGDLAGEEKYSPECFIDYVDNKIFPDVDFKLSFRFDQDTTSSGTYFYIWDEENSSGEWRYPIEGAPPSDLRINLQEKGFKEGIGLMVDKLNSVSIEEYTFESNPSWIERLLSSKVKAQKISLFFEKDGKNYQLDGEYYDYFDSKGRVENPSLLKKGILTKYAKLKVAE